MTILLDFALAYAKRGMRVFPVKGKWPLIKGGCLAATTNQQKIKEWWSIWENANIGIATGTVSGVWVLDVDGAEGMASLRSLQEKYGPLPNTVEVITGGGGKHLYFRCTASMGNRVKFQSGLDTRADGGFIIAPPSTHPNGRLYIWGPNCANAIADAPQWLIDLVLRPACRVELNPGGPVPEGSRNDTIARMAGRLLRQDMDGDFVLDLLLAFNESRCVPPLPNAEVKRTVESIARIEMARRAKDARPLQTPAEPRP
ncbi:bifunctional DNA primase/polymerase [Rhodopila sp.]|uniref:bifunctional DNA primase/polymerase n=1 Tax=Rhodopila sp. TaxID=2480087 RepID=UPI003D112167